DQLTRHYLQPLQQTRYWKDVEFLSRWPTYATKTSVLFDRGLDLLLESAHVWTRPGRWFPAKCVQWLQRVRRLAGPTQWRELQTDLGRLGKALRLQDVLGRPALGRLLLDSTLNALRDLGRRPRPHPPREGSFQLFYRVTGDGPPEARGAAN